MTKVLIAAMLLTASGLPALAQTSSKMNCAHYGAMNAAGERRMRPSAPTASPGRRPAEAERGSWLAAIYDATAWYWDSSLHELAYGRAYRRLLERLHADGWCEGPLSSVLDCGIGAGLLSQAFVAAFGRPAWTLGVDLSSRLLARARARLGRCGAPVRLLRADARALPLGDRVVDASLCGLVLDHLADPTGALRELARVSRPGALAVVVTTRPHAPDLPFRWIFRYRPPRPANVERAMRAAGFRDVRRYGLTGLARPFGTALVGRVA